MADGLYNSSYELLIGIQEGEDESPQSSHFGEEGTHLLLGWMGELVLKGDERVEDLVGLWG